MVDRFDGDQFPRTDPYGLHARFGKLSGNDRLTVNNNAAPAAFTFNAYVHQR